MMSALVIALASLVAFAAATGPSEDWKNNNKTIRLSIQDSSVTGCATQEACRNVMADLESKAENARKLNENEYYAVDGYRNWLESGGFQGRYWSDEVTKDLQTAENVLASISFFLSAGDLDVSAIKAAATALDKAVKKLGSNLTENQKRAFDSVVDVLFNLLPTAYYISRTIFASEAVLFFKIISVAVNYAKIIVQALIDYNE